MSFQADKCKVILPGINNPRFSYYMNRAELWDNTGREGMRVYINPSLKPSNRWRKDTNKTKAVLKHTVLKLYKQ